MMSTAAVADAVLLSREVEMKNELTLPLSKPSDITLSIPAHDLSFPSYALPLSDSNHSFTSQRHISAPETPSATVPYLPVGVLRRSDNRVLENPSFPDAELAILQKQGWVKLAWHTYESHTGWSFAQVYVLPDDVGRNIISRTSSACRKALKLVLSLVDRSSAAWDGEFRTTLSQHETNAAEDESLWYIFNTLNNPSPTQEDVEDGDGRLAMQELMFSSRAHNTDTLESSGVLGLKTPLHPYQSRSAATMIQREVHPKQMLDPRVQVYKTPFGQEYYYDKEDGILLCEKRLYSEACGGILAETMGCGKTLICLAVILSTRGHVPRIPTEYQNTSNPVRDTTGSLMQMAAATAGRFSIPWQNHFQRLKESGINYERCVQTCVLNRGKYTISPPPSRYQSRGGWLSRPGAVSLYLNSGTLIIVPPNLVDHWRMEIDTHTEGLRVLILRNRNDKTPPMNELFDYDIILFSRTRFEKEAGEPETNRRSPSASSESPLKRFHWLRIIVDEGHNVAGHGHKSSTVHLLDQLHIERRWVVSGTPSNGLYGAELSLASQQALATDAWPADDTASSVLLSRKQTGTAIDEEMKDVDKLRLIVVEFLKHKPWANSRSEDPANWTKYIKPIGEDGKRRKSPSLRAVLQGLVVRHRLDVINNELPLPRLYNRVVSLEPTFYDKVSLNIFLFSLTVNAITSERIDQDYMFQSRNRKHISLLINNLRQAGFWWTGHKQKELETTIDVALKYLEKNREKMSEGDTLLLMEGLHIAHRALSCESYSAFCHLDELGVYVEDFPEHAREQWSLTFNNGVPDSNKPLLLGISHARHAQLFVTSNLTADDPSEGLAGAGIVARRQLSQRSEKSVKSANESGAADTLTHKNKPAENRSPRKTFLRGITRKLSPELPLAKTKVVATTSAKLTYLLDRVQELHKTEKIIIFYENNNTAFWIAEGLEMLGIEFRIYANTLKTSQKSAYLSLFEESSSVRILLMDLRQASHGLHVASASRIFIVNPIWRPNVESQAIKRAHRIGQTRPVFVETLVLKDTLEEKMLRRRQEMTNSEMQHAEKDMLEDSTMTSIIQRERFYPLPENDEHIRPSYLREPSGFFDRHELPIPDDYSRETKSSIEYPITPTKRKSSRDGTGIAWIESDISPEYTPKKKKTVPRFQIVTENGIVMTPPRASPSPDRSDLTPQ
ncbi:putative SNF2 family helicase [Talaromyces proteolyticus]|uniref:SNF2 family helicase n=1 Tax=Talaromyces proteolyticus TaxID=1131652 RepID=A0AAD4KVJ9_9EURO|nr:putative SNF2 family helicase [Talaromyces proteolyticus]KAH8697671.1 putative SNF2 family helicase [Talaromyces proteolyticus]